MKKWMCAAMAVVLMFAVGSFASAAPKTPKVPKEKKEVKTVDQKFADMDTNGDGKLSLEEYQASFKTDSTKAKAEKDFKKWDTDSSGDLTLDEFKAKGKQAKPKKPDSLK
ncbi:MAG: EF-hand domain-containing protein [Planctomycetia bacterium]|nr:EF-hand domain-containing protein [Planctomycetia bacterium]